MMYSNSKYQELLAQAERAKDEYNAEFGKTGVLAGKALDLYNAWVGVERRITEMGEAGVTEFLASRDRKRKRR